MGNVEYEEFCVLACNVVSTDVSEEHVAFVFLIEVYRNGLGYIGWKEGSQSLRRDRESIKLEVVPVLN
jgi:hypothetical protein